MRFHGLVDPDANTILSFDFWDTIVINLESPRDRWISTMRELMKEFQLPHDVEIYEIWYEKISYSLRRLNSENGSDFEFKSISVWIFLSSLIFVETSERLRFQKRAQEIYFQKAHAGSKLNEYFQTFYTKAQNKECIVITSDYDYDRSFLFNLLQLKGIDFPIENIFVSSDFLANKFSGRLFGKLFELFPGKQLIHVGDNFRSDFLSARKYGVHTIYHAKFCTFVFSKIVYLIEKSFTQIKKLPLRIPTFRNDLRLLSSALHQFQHFIESNILQADSILFLGSEGAFFSNLFSDDFHLRNSSRCVNLGRKEILRTLHALDPDFVLTILLIEAFNISELLKYFESFTSISLSEIKELINPNFQKDPLPHEEVQKDEFLQSLEVSRESKLDSKIFTVDIGYKATFASALSRVQKSRVSAIQMLGFEQIQKSDKFEVRTLHQVEIPKFGRPFSTKYLEAILGAGPRSEYSKHIPLIEIQSLISAQNPKKQIRISKLIAFSRFPSKRIRNAIISDRLDDLRLEKVNDESINSA